MGQLLRMSEEKQAQALAGVKKKKRVKKKSYALLSLDSDKGKDVSRTVWKFFHTDCTRVSGKQSMSSH